jgi:hypothetical protein
VKLKPAFWIVDGSCKWIHDTQDKLSISISVQQMGGGEQIFALTKPAGDELEKAVVETVQSALAGSGPVTPAQAQAGEEKVMSEHVSQFERFREPQAPLLNIPTNTTSFTVTDAWGQARQMPVNPTLLELQRRHAEAFAEAARKAILLNPNDMHAKLSLGMQMCGRSDEAGNKEGEDLLKQVAASGSAESIRASNYLSDIKNGRIIWEKDPRGFWKNVGHGQPASFPLQDSNATKQAAEYSAKVTAQIEAEQHHTNAIRRAQRVIRLEPDRVQPPAMPFPTAAKRWNNKVFIASGTVLNVYDTDRRTLRPVDLPMVITNGICDLEADDNDLWLGTDGGLLRVPLSGGAVRAFTEKDGLPAPCVASLRKAGSRLYMGLAGKGGGAFGYLDIGSEKFIGLMSGPDVTRDWNKQIHQPPGLRIHAIATADGTNFWISSDLGFQQFNSGAGQWDPAMPADFNNEIGRLTQHSLSVNPHFVAAVDYKHCAALRRLPGEEWTRLDVATNQNNYFTESVALDPEADQLWVGGMRGNVKLIDLAKSEIIAEGDFPSPSIQQVIRILPGRDNVVVIDGGARNELVVVHCIEKSALREPPPAAEVAKSNGSFNLAARSEHPLPVKQNAWRVGAVGGGNLSACSGGSALGKGQLLVAFGATLKRFDWSGGVGIGSDADFEKVDLPPQVKDPIVALASDDQDLWLGTDGGGLIRVPQSGGAPTVFTEQDGLPMSSIRSLAVYPGRLMIGFGIGKRGTFGYLDTKTLKFTGALPPGTNLKSGSESLEPPPRQAVWQIRSVDDGNTCWIASESAFYKFKFPDEWSLQMPAPGLFDTPTVGKFRTASVSKKYVATAVASGGVAICNVSGGPWTHLDLSTNQVENDVTSLAIDFDVPNYLWLAGHGKLTVLDMDTRKIVCEYRVAFFNGPIDYLVIYPRDIFFLQEREGVYDLYTWSKPAY